MVMGKRVVKPKSVDSRAPAGRNTPECPDIKELLLGPGPRIDNLVPERKPRRRRKPPAFD
jgi:hypothetical protein